MLPTKQRSVAMNTSKLTMRRSFACRTPLALIFFAIAVTIFPSAAAGESVTYRYTGQIHFDVKRVPFSRFGSYLSISDLSDFQPPLRRSGLYLRTMHEGGQNAFQLQLTRAGVTIPFTVSATPTLLTLSADSAFVEISFQGPDQLRIRGHGAGLQLTADAAWLVPYQHGHWEINTSAMKYMLLPIDGDLHTSRTTSSDGAGTKVLTVQAAHDADTFEAELDAYTSGWNAHDVEGTFDDAQRKEQLAFQRWLDTMPKVDAAFGPGSELAAYVNWESVVAPSGNLKRPAMLMSKNWMISVWSWDQAFNAMAATLSNPNLAWDQYLLPFDLQNAQGALPDKWDADSIAWEFSKPPIHGWVLAWMLHHEHFQDRKHLEQVYPLLSRWTKWYLRYRDSNQDGLPEYRHGNEAGWDNATVFDEGGPIESPDLSAYLSVQMEVLADVAARLGRPAEARQWKQQSNQLLERMLQRFWRDGAFVAIHVTDGHPIRSQSLLLDMPIILGTRLPASVQAKLIADLRKRASEYSFGLASEPGNSPFYTADGYWRGPIWAPSTMIITAGLDEMGEHTLSDSLKERFCKMAQKSGMAENFDAQTGDGLRDPAYTWTSSVFLLFAHELAEPGAASQHMSTSIPARKRETTVR
jgi:mannosylglycerate hydrolase MGH1-like protein